MDNNATPESSTESMVSLDRAAEIKFAHAQSLQDRQSSVEYMKAVLQLMIGGSSFLTTAILAIIALRHDAGNVAWLAVTMLPSLLAVLSGMIAAHKLFLSKVAFGHYWEARALGYWVPPDTKRKEKMDEGDRHRKHAIRWIYAGFAGFALAAISAFVAIV